MKRQNKKFMKNPIKFCFLALLIFTANNVSAQQTGKINFEQIGIAFTIPSGWMGQEADGMYLMGSNTIPGLVLMIPQNYADMEAMKKDIQAGYADAAGTVLKPEGSIEVLGDGALGVVYTGTVEGQPAKGYLIGVLNPHGQEVGILSVTTIDQYSEAQPKVAKAIWKSLEFSEPTTGPIIEQWKKDLSGVKLTYMNSYSSSSYVDGGISGGYSTKIVFDLCSAGYFNYYGSDDMSMGGDYSSAYSSNKGKGSGSWDIVVSADGSPLLQLKFNNGKVWEYHIEWKGEEFHMDGKRYFRTWSGDNAPSCN